jgi:uracil-DNA glycosylase
VNPKPVACQGCPLHQTGRGFAPSTGQASALIAIVGEALGQTEAEQGEPFVGQAGAYLNRAFGLLGVNRADYRIGNVVSCQPPRDWLVGAPWEQGAIAHCHTHRMLNLYGYSPKVYLTMGVTATKTVLKDILNIDYAGKLDHWQGYVLGTEPGPYVIPTFHPAFLLRGQQRLLGAVLFALRRAMEVASFGHNPKPVSLVVDPDPEWFDDWSTNVTDESWLAVDVENPATPGNDEDELVSGVAQITRVNFSINPDQGLTVPWDPRYRATIDRLLAGPCPKVMWNERYDTSVLRKHGTKVNGTILDAMWAWHMLQSAMPRSLGFASAYYSDLSPWKHLSSTNFGHYSAMDAVQTLRCMFGITKDLRASNQWDTYLHHIVKLDQHVLHPMEEIGLKLNQEKLSAFDAELEARSATILADIQSSIPPHLRPLTGGWKTYPDGHDSKDVVVQTVKKVVQCCETCGAVDVTTRHKCPAAPVGRKEAK